MPSGARIVDMRTRMAMVGLVVAAGLAMAAGNGRGRALNAHEILVAETAEEMVARGDLLVPYFNGAIRLEKPPLAYWLTIAAHRLRGAPQGTPVGELDARAPSLVCGLLLLLVTFALGVAAYGDERVGLAGAAVLATTYHFFTFSRSARPEILCALFCNLALLAFLLAIRRAEHARSTLGASLLGWVAVAAAILAKGPQLPLFFLVGIALGLRSWEPRVRFGAALLPWRGLLVVALVLPYFAYLATQADHATSFWAAQMVQGESVPIWLRPLRLYYVFAVLAGVAPWIATLALPWLAERTRRHPSTRLLGWCVLVTVACLSFAGKLRHHYVLPVIPLVSVAIGAALVEISRSLRAGEPSSIGIRRVAIAQAALTVIALVALAGMATMRSPVTESRMWPWAFPWLLLAAGLARFAWRSVQLRPSRAFAAYVSALLSAWTAVSLAGLDLSRRWESDAKFASELDRLVPPGLPVVLESGTHESVVYYGNRRIILSTARDWLAAHPNDPTTYFVCEGSCEGVDGDIVTAERGRSENEPMILLRPHSQPSAQSPDSGSASTAPAPGPQ